MLSVVSLGCFRNTFDSENFLSRLTRKKARALQEGKETVFINTCGFIHDARQESVRAIEENIRLKKEGKVTRVIVGGCLVRRYYKELLAKYPEADALLDIEGVNNLEPRTCFLQKKPYVFLKIAEGCSWKCSYCAIPFIKGNYQSRALPEILEEVRHLDAQGFKELIIIAQDTSSWQHESAYRKNDEPLVRLAERILKTIKTIQWVRFLYMHPLTLSRAFIGLIAHEKKICSYLDLPIQHINERILGLMGRKATRQKILELIAHTKAQRRKIALRTSVIAGFPTESDAEFKELCGFIKEVRFDRLGAFIYSSEEQTPAASLKQVSLRVRNERFHSLMRLQRGISSRNLKSLIGSTVAVLIEEQCGEDTYQGRTQYDAPDIDGAVGVSSREPLMAGQIIPVEITSSGAYDMYGRVVNRE